MHSKHLTRKSYIEEFVADSSSTLYIYIYMYSSVVTPLELLSQSSGKYSISQYTATLLPILPTDYECCQAWNELRLRYSAGNSFCWQYLLLYLFPNYELNEH